MDPRNEERAGVMAHRVKGFHDTALKLQKGAAHVLKSEGNCAKSYVGLSESFQSMARSEKNRNLQQSMNAIAAALSEIEGHRSSLVLDRLHSSLVQKIKDMDESCNQPIAVLLKDRNHSVKSSIRFKDQFEQLASRGTVSAQSAKKLERKKIQLQQEEKRVYTIDRGLQKNLLKYEQKRIHDCEDIFEDFVKGQLLFHCRAIEALTASLKAIGRIDTAAGVEQLCEDLRISPSQLQVAPTMGVTTKNSSDPVDDTPASIEVPENKQDSAH